MARLADSVRSMVEKYGEVVVLSRSGGDSVSVRAKVFAYTPEQQQGGIVQGDHQVVLSPALLTAAGWSHGEPQRFDTVTRAGGDQFTVQSSTAHHDGTEAARYSLWVR